MALINCSECSKEISDKAQLCPNCGAPVEKIENSKQNVTSAIPQPPKPKRSSAGLIILVSLLVLVGIVAIIISNNPNALPGFKIEINTPKPIVVTSRSDGDKSGLLKARMTVHATIQNQGGDGRVLVTFHVYQDGKDFDRSKSIYLRANQNEDLEETFEQVRYLGGKATYDVDVRAE
jgi:hypothetical protein